MDGKIMDREAVVQNLKDAGCGEEMIKEFFKCEAEGCEKQQLCLLAKHRLKLLNKIHLYQKKIDCLDYLIFRLKERKKKG